MALGGGAEEAGPVTRAVVAHEALGFDAEGGEVSQSAFEEKDGTVLALVGHDLSESQPGSVVDANMDELPSGPAHLIAPVPGHAVTGAHDFSQLFDIEVEELAGELALVTHHRRSRFQVAEPGQAMATQEARDGRAGEAALARDLGARET